MKSFRHAPGGHFRQNLDPLQVALAHRNNPIRNLRRH